MPEVRPLDVALDEAEARGRLPASRAAASAAARRARARRAPSAPASSCGRGSSPAARTHTTSSTWGSPAACARNSLPRKPVAPVSSTRRRGALAEGREPGARLLLQLLDPCPDLPLGEMRRLPELEGVVACRDTEQPLDAPGVRGVAGQVRDHAPDARARSPRRPSGPSSRGARSRSRGSAGSPGTAPRSRPGGGRGARGRGARAGSMGPSSGSPVARSTLTMYWPGDMSTGRGRLGRAAPACAADAFRRWRARARTSFPRGAWTPEPTPWPLRHVRQPQSVRIDSIGILARLLDCPPKIARARVWRGHGA